MSHILTLLFIVFAAWASEKKSVCLAELQEGRRILDVNLVGCRTWKLK